MLHALVVRRLQLLPIRGDIMESKAKLFGHPIHQMLIVFPLGLLGTSFVFDIIHVATDSGRWADVAFWMIASGIIGGLVAAVFGVIDFVAIQSGTRARRVGTLHGVGNVVVVALFAVSWLMRRDAPADPGTLPIVLSAVGVSLALITGWLGGELINRLGVGVSDGAHLDAPSSLSHRPASERASGRGRPGYIEPRGGAPRSGPLSAG
jgi:uncharacterized membrane protein